MGLGERERTRRRYPTHAPRHTPTNPRTNPPPHKIKHQELSKIQDRGDVAWALRMYENSRLVRSSAVHGLARIASDILFQSRALFQNRVIGSFVGLMMTVSMPLILEFLYQNVLDEEDWGNAVSRLSNLAAYEDKTNTYKSVREAQAALQAKERQLVGQP